MAVASTDGIVVNSHFGMAESFYIYEIDGDKVRCADRRAIDEEAKGCACGDADDHNKKLLKKIETIKDCKYVVISRIGVGAENLLSEYDIKSYEIPGFIEESLNQLISYVKLDDLFNLY